MVQSMDNFTNATRLKVGDEFTIADRYAVRPSWWRRLLLWLGFRRKATRLQRFVVKAEHIGEPDEEGTRRIDVRF